MTISDAQAYLSQELKKIYEDGEASTISDWVIESITQIKKTDRINHRKVELTQGQADQLQLYLNRLLEYEPVQYVLNEAWFCGLKFYVDKNVLIPRRETEELVEWIITNCKFPIDKLSILDIGTGSGCIAITLKRRFGKADVSGCDISIDALGVSKKNAELLGADVNFMHVDVLSENERSKLGNYDIIVSNPPYVTHKERYSMKANVLEYEPAKALFVPDNDPLVFYRAIADFGKTHLNRDGSIYLEINESLGHLTSKLFDEKGYETELKKDLQGKDRMLKVSARRD